MHTTPASHPSTPPAPASSPPRRTPRLASLDDNALIERVDSLTRLERCNTLEILLHLVEVDRRKLWRPLEYRSMFDYCVRRLRYSEAAAGRRIRTARLIARYPHVYARIRQGRLSLCAVAKIARAVLDDGRADLIDRIEGKRLDQVDAILATHRNPSRPVRESIRLLCVERPIGGPQRPPRLGESGDPAGGAAGASSQPVGSGSGVASGVPGTAAAETSGALPNGAAESTAGAAGSAGHDVPTGTTAHDQNGGRKLTRVERIFRFQFGIDARTMAKFSRVQSIAARRNGRHVDLSDLFGMLCDVYLDRYDAATRARSDGTRKRKAAAGPDSGRKQAAGPESTMAGSSAKPVPRAVRDAVVRRDGGRCTFVERNGERCTETIALQVDHVRPRALGGTNDPSNLRAMCSAHNRLLAERTFGRRTIERAIEEATSRGGLPSPPVAAGPSPAGRSRELTERGPGAEP